MRKLLTVAALAAFALGGVAACTTAPPTGDASSGATTSAPADQTASVCTEAIAYEQTQSAAALAKIQQGSDDVKNGNAAELPQIQADVTKILSDWTTKFTELSQKPVKPEVKASLNEWLTFLGQVASQAGTTTADQVTAKVTELHGKLVAACA